MTSGFGSVIHTSRNGPTHGPQASVLALGAPISLQRGLNWNHPERPGGGIDSTVDEKLTLARDWQINSVDTWMNVTDRMIRGAHVQDKAAEKALDVRDAAIEQRGGGAYLDISDWLSAVDDHARQHQWTDEQVNVVSRMAVKAYYAEQQLAEDGLLPAGERVVTMFAYDLAHGTYLAHAGARMGFANPRTVAQMLDAIGHNAASLYPSWASFAAAYVLGSSVLYGGYPTDTFYTEPAAAVKTLLSDRMSPWTNIDFPGKP